MKLTSYRDLEHLSWEDILAENWGGFRPPRLSNPDCIWFLPHHNNPCLWASYQTKGECF
jgi:hypothetical protein